jgi:hypothetical protein
MTDSFFWFCIHRWTITLQRNIFEISLNDGQENDKNDEKISGDWKTSANKSNLLYL